MLYVPAFSEQVSMVNPINPTRDHHEEHDEMSKGKPILKCQIQLF
jgi:hypothetical protein